MKDSFLLLLLLLATLTAWGQPTPSSTQLVETAQVLEQAYKDQSSAELAKFLTEWSQHLPAVTKAELQRLPARHQEAYAVFTAFYVPHQLGRLGGSEWGNDLYQKVKFLLVQNSLKIQVENSAVRDSIDNFRPVVAVPGKQAVYLTSAREKTLNAFLGNTHLPLGAGGIMNPARSSGESEKRQQFLGSCLRIWHGHWGGYWQLNSYPVAYTVTFSKDMQSAQIDFRMVYEGGSATLKKIQGNWQLLSSRRTWIE